MHFTLTELISWGLFLMLALAIGRVVVAILFAGASLVITGIFTVVKNFLAETPDDEW